LIGAEGPGLVAGVVTHRQHPETANGAVFMNLEDETGHVNVIFSKGAWLRWKEVARREPALIIRGSLQRGQGEVHRDDRTGAQRRRLLAVVGLVAVEGRVHVAPFDDLGQVAVDDVAGAARDRQVADQGPVELEADEAVVLARHEVIAQLGQGVTAVEVVGVGDAEGGVGASRGWHGASTASTVPRRFSWTAKETLCPLGQNCPTCSTIWGPVSGLTTMTMSSKPAAKASEAMRSMTPSPCMPIGASCLRPP
jgi:hypothetical protein